MSSTKTVLCRPLPRLRVYHDRRLARCPLAGTQRLAQRERKAGKCKERRIFRQHCSSYDRCSSQSYTLQFPSIYHCPRQHPSSFSSSTYPSNPLSAGILLTSVLRCPLIFSKSSFFSARSAVCFAPLCMCQGGTITTVWKSVSLPLPFLFSSPLRPCPCPPPLKS